MTIAAPAESERREPRPAGQPEHAKQPASKHPRSPGTDDRQHRTETAKHAGPPSPDARANRNAAHPVPPTPRQPVHTLAPCGAGMVTGCAGHRLAGGERAC